MTNKKPGLMTKASLLFRSIWPAMPTSDKQLIKELHVKHLAAIEEEKQAADQRALRRKNINESLAKATAESLATGKPVRASFPLEPYVPPAGVCPPEFKSGLAMDASWKNLIQDSYGEIYGGGLYNGTLAVDTCGFPGFPYLTELTQITEYRDMSERTAAEMTRKWIEFRSEGDGDKSAVIKTIEKELKRFNVRDLFRQAAVLDGFMGRSQIFIDLDYTTPTEGADDELSKPIMLNKYKIKKGSLKGFKIVEPITTYPASYNATNPLAGDYYVPSAWYVYGKNVHASRLLTFISRPLPNLLKPIYNFSGISLSQLAQPYVDYWLNTRDSVGKLLRNFSITWLASDLDTLLQASGDDLIRRVQLFTKLRDNQGVFLLNKDTETMGQLNAPLSGLDHLQAQAQEHMAAVAKTPLVVLLGITPSGLNASAADDLYVYYDFIADQQEALFRRPLETIIQIIQLNSFGVVDHEITFDFVSLFALKEAEAATIRKSDADIDNAYIATGVLSPEEVRTRIAASPRSGYNNINADEVPAPPNPQEDPNGTETSGESDEDAAGGGDGDAGRDLSDPVLDIMSAADSYAADGGFRGNQHIGGICDSDHPSDVAAKLSRAATQASQLARQLRTKRAMSAASDAHSRALEAHERALFSATTSTAPMHQAYIDAHRASMSIHDVEAKSL
jgi:phage-related protein (TIGR01555 family)